MVDEYLISNTTTGYMNPENSAGVVSKLGVGIQELGRPIIETVGSERGGRRYRAGANCV